MANIIYNYPKSSCTCVDCNTKTYNFSNKGIETNLSVRDCEISPYYDCVNKRLFKFDTEPKEEIGYTYLNKLWSSSYDPSFEKISCNNNDKGCKTVYASTDPRLIDVARGGQILTLDRPPLNSKIKLDDINTDVKLNCYGQNYKTYSDISEGQINYYIDNSISDAFYKPNFLNKAYSIGTMYKDPMGAMKPQYDRVPKIQKDCLDTIEGGYDGGLSWIEDSSEHREDLLARQMRKRNEQRWSPRWYKKLS